MIQEDPFFSLFTCFFFSSDNRFPPPLRHSPNRLQARQTEDQDAGTCRIDRSSNKNSRRLQSTQFSQLRPRGSHAGVQRAQTGFVQAEEVRQWCLLTEITDFSRFLSEEIHGCKPLKSASLKTLGANVKTQNAAKRIEPADLSKKAFSLQHQDETQLSDTRRRAHVDLPTVKFFKKTKAPVYRNRASAEIPLHPPLRDKPSLVPRPRAADHRRVQKTRPGLSSRADSGGGGQASDPAQ